MRRLVKRLLKKYNYPPKEAEDALETVLLQCEQWTDNDDYIESQNLISMPKTYEIDENFSIAAEP